MFYVFPKLGLLTLKSLKCEHTSSCVCEREREREREERREKERERGKERERKISSMSQLLSHMFLNMT